MNVANSSIPSKFCVACGKDVSQAKRTKVPSGDYYCQPCYLARSAGDQSAPPTPPATASPPVPAATTKRRIYLALGLAFVIIAGIAAYLWLDDPSRSTGIIPEAQAPAGHRRTVTTSPAPRVAAANLNARSRNGRTALNLAAAGGHQAQAQSLLAQGADVNATDSDGATPLHAAARRGHRGLAEFLLSKGADINAKDTHGKTPLALATERGHTDTAEFLRQHGGTK